MMTIGYEGETIKSVLDWNDGKVLDGVCCVASRAIVRKRVHQVCYECGGLC